MLGMGNFNYLMYLRQSSFVKNRRSQLTNYSVRFFYLPELDKQNRNLFVQYVYHAHCKLQEKQLQEIKINYNKRQANLKYYNAKVFSFFSITYTITLLLSKLEYIKFVTELDSERPFYGHQVKTAHKQLIFEIM